MTATPVTVGRSALVRAAGLNVGILVMNPDPDDPAARITIAPVGGARSDNVIAEVRRGDRLTVGGRIVTVTDVVHGPPPAGRVELTIDDDQQGDERSEGK